MKFKVVVTYDNSLKATQEMMPTFVQATVRLQDIVAKLVLAGNTGVLGRVYELKEEMVVELRGEVVKDALDEEARAKSSEESSERG